MSDGAAALEARWEALRAAGRVALIPYLTAGYPSADATVAALRMLEQEGADLVEVGVPFSDPLADGPVIQRSSFAALERGMSVRGVLDLIRQARLGIPVIVFSYVNPLLRYGVTRFLADAEAAGCAGLLLTDVPVGADPALERSIADSALARIPLASLTTGDDRLRALAAAGEGFLYLISRLGVTGSPTAIGQQVESAVARLRAVTRLPIAVGFGIGAGEQAAEVARFADGVVVGSALVERTAEGLDAARALVRELRQALDTVAVTP